MKNTFLFGTFRFYFSYIIAFISFMTVLIIRRKRIQQRQNIQLVKNKKANKYAKKRLRSASVYLKENKPEPFYEEILKAVWGYLSDKLNIPVADLSKESAFKTLKDYGIEEKLTDKFINLIDNCEYARFAPASESSQMDNMYSDAIKMISKLEQKLK